jgi:hypothetical protein
MYFFRVCKMSEVQNLDKQNVEEQSIEKSCPPKKRPARPARPARRARHGGARSLPQDDEVMSECQTEVEVLLEELENLFDDLRIHVKIESPELFQNITRYGKGKKRMVSHDHLEMVKASDFATLLHQTDKYLVYATLQKAKLERFRSKVYHRLDDLV